MLSTVEHEIDEVLGLGSALQNCNPTDPNAITACKNAGAWSFATPGATPFGDPTPEDLYRWNAEVGGARTLGTKCQSQTSAFFAYGPSTGAIARFNNMCNGGDFGDWAGGPFPRVQDAFATSGITPPLSVAEFNALSAIGWDIGAPEPATYVMTLGALAVFGLLKRRTQ